jgi:hypothetical protein
MGKVRIKISGIYSPFSFFDVFKENLWVNTECN